MGPGQSELTQKSVGDGTSTLALEPMGRVNQSSKQRVPVVPQNADLSPQKKKKKKKKKKTEKENNGDKMVYLYLPEHLNSLESLHDYQLSIWHLFVKESELCPSDHDCKEGGRLLTKSVVSTAQFDQKVCGNFRSSVELWVAFNIGSQWSVSRGNGR